MSPIGDVQTPIQPPANEPSAAGAAPAKVRQRARQRRRNVWIAVGAVVLIAAAVALWWFVIRDDSSDTTGQVTVPEGSGGSGDVDLPQNPSLGASATIDGVSADEPVDLTFGEESDFDIAVVYDGNVTMSDITVTLEFQGPDGVPDD